MQALPVSLTRIIRRQMEKGGSAVHKANQGGSNEVLGNSTATAFEDKMNRIDPSQPKEVISRCLAFEGIRLNLWLALQTPKLPETTL